MHQGRTKKFINFPSKYVYLKQCGEQWEAQHYGISCEHFAQWKRENDPNFADTALDGHLKRHGIDCPKAGNIS